MACSGNSALHCCIFAGKNCQYLEVDTMPDRHWVCGLMRELKDWDMVIVSKRYQRDIIPLMAEHIWPHYDIKYNCKTWPSETCDCNGIM